MFKPNSSTARRRAAPPIGGVTVPVKSGDQSQTKPRLYHFFYVDMTPITPVWPSGFIDIIPGWISPDDFRSCRNG